MKLEHAPFPPGWWATSLDNVGLEVQRPRVGTYGRYNQTSLPALPVELNGSFEWLLKLPILELHVGAECANENKLALQKLIRACDSKRVSLPRTLTDFFANPEWQARIRSNTDCFLDLASAPVPSPKGNGALVRFLADSQGCIFWYLFIPDSSNDHAVVSSPDFYDAEAERKDTKDETDIVFAEESFEAFMCRFSIENELWFSEYDGTPISQIGRQYLENYRSAPADRLSSQQRS